MTRQLAWYHRPAGVLVTPAGVRHEADPSTVGSHACALCALLIPIVHPFSLPLFLSSSQDPLIKFENQGLPAEWHRRQCRSVVTRTTPIPCLLAPSYLSFSLLDSFSRWKHLFCPNVIWSLSSFEIGSDSRRYILDNSISMLRIKRVIARIKLSLLIHRMFHITHILFYSKISTGIKLFWC